MAEYLIKHARIGCVPGVDFGANSEGYIRFCTCRSREELTGALASMKEALVARRDPLTTRLRPGADPPGRRSARQPTNFIGSVIARITDVTPSALDACAHDVPSRCASIRPELPEVMIGVLGDQRTVFVVRQVAEGGMLGERGRRASRPRNASSAAANAFFSSSRRRSGQRAINSGAVGAPLGIGR